MDKLRAAEEMSAALRFMESGDYLAAAYRCDQAASACLALGGYKFGADDKLARARKDADDNHAAYCAAKDELAEIKAAYCAAKDELAEIKAGKEAMNLQQELTKWLSKQHVTRENIGMIRNSCFVPWVSEWNRIVVTETAARQDLLRRIQTKLRQGRAK